ncbi:MAG: MBL fold metallo-hydrolase [Myxococcales bacterium]
MALSYCVLASGSSGNCLWVRGGGVQLFIDCGVSARMAGHRLAEVGGNLQDVSAIICTHGHGDHVMGTSVLARKSGIDIYATPGTVRALPSGMPNERLKALPYGGTLTIGGLTVETVPTSHDAPQGVAIRVTDGETSLGVITDQGQPTPAIAKAFRGLDGLLLESNHDVPMLLNGPYPERLKKRIRGNWGHLSNEQCTVVLAELLHEGLQHVTLGHISEHNNTTDLVRAATEGMLEKRGGAAPRLAVALQRKVGPVITLTPSGRTQPRKAQQLAFAFGSRA